MKRNIKFNSYFSCFPRRVRENSNELFYKRRKTILKHKFTGVIVAAGDSRRMTESKFPKQLLKLKKPLKQQLSLQDTLLGRTISQFQQESYINRVLIISGKFHEQFVSWLKTRHIFQDIRIPIEIVNVPKGWKEQNRVLKEKLASDEIAIITAGDLFHTQSNLSKAVIWADSIQENIPFLSLVLSGKLNYRIFPFQTSFWILNKSLLNFAEEINPESYFDMYGLAAKLIRSGKIRLFASGQIINLNTQKDYRFTLEYIRHEAE